MSRRAPAPGVRSSAAMHCPAGVCATGPSLPPPATLSSVFPRGGPTAGGTAILLRGHGFRGFDPGAHCEFDALLAPAVAWAEDVSTVALNCTAPPMPMAELTPVRARLSPALHAASSVRFRYYDQPQVRGLQPAGGTARGGTRVAVYGAGFGPYAELQGLALCRFGSARVAADSVSSAAAVARAVVVGADGQLTAGRTGSLAGGGLLGPAASPPLRTPARPHAAIGSAPRRCPSAVPMASARGSALGSARARRPHLFRTRLAALGGSARVADSTACRAPRHARAALGGGDRECRLRHRAPLHLAGVGDSRRAAGGWTDGQTNGSGGDRMEIGWVGR